MGFGEALEVVSSWFGPICRLLLRAFWERGRFQFLYSFVKRDERQQNANERDD